MRSCQVIEIVTPKGFVLTGLWFGPKKAKRAIIFVHGLTGSAFSMRSTVDALAGKDTAVVTFNNRGFGQINSIKRKRGGKSEYVSAGTAHEVFTDSIDDLQGAINFAKKASVKNIYLAGHSTGAQKSIYWASKKREKRVKGIILLGPLSDYADTKGSKKIAAGVRAARALVKKGKADELMPQRFTEWFVCDAQRYLSLYTPDSKEEIFSYTQPSKRPKTLQSVRIPVLVLFAGDDEYSKISPAKLAQWFDKNLPVPHKVSIVPKVGHSFRGGEKRVAKEIRSFIASH